MRPTAQQLCDYVESDLFRQRCADLRARQEAGEDFDLPRIAEELALPLEVAAAMMQGTVDGTLPKVVIPQTGGRPN